MSIHTKLSCRPCLSYISSVPGHHQNNDICETHVETATPVCRERRASSPPQRLLPSMRATLAQVVEVLGVEHGELHVTDGGQGAPMLPRARTGRVLQTVKDSPLGMELNWGAAEVKEWMWTGHVSLMRVRHPKGLGKNSMLPQSTTSDIKDQNGHFETTMCFLFFGVRISTHVAV